MPFSTARYSWFKVIICLVGLAQLQGCATPKQVAEPQADDKGVAELFEGIAEARGKPQPVPQQATPKVQLPSGKPTLSTLNWEVISGATSSGNFLTGSIDERFRRPVAIAVQGEFIYVVDAGLNALLRYDRATAQMSRVLDLRVAVKGEVADIYVANDFSFYLADTDGSRVLHYDREGRLIQVYENHFNLAKPVAIAVLDNGDVVVADGHYDHLAHFNSMGQLIATYGGRGLGTAEFLSIMTMAHGPDGYYVGARVGQRLQVITENGEYGYSFEEGKVVFPGAIAVDRHNRSYVADYMDNQIKVFDRGRLVASIGGHGTAPGQFMRITDIWVDDTFLYVVDSLGARIQIARIVAEQ